MTCSEVICPAAISHGFQSICSAILATIAQVVALVANQQLEAAVAGVFATTQCSAVSACLEQLWK